MGDEKVVKGPEVQFEGAALSADALVTGQDQVQEQEQNPLDEEVVRIMADYLYYLESTDRVKILAPYARFQGMYGLTFLPVPRDTLVELIARENEPVGQLLRESDLGQTLPDSYRLEDQLPSPVSKLLKKSHLDIAAVVRTCKEQNNRRLVIPNASFLSLFIEDGDIYRKYLQLFPQVDRSTLVDYTVGNAEENERKLPSPLPSYLIDLVRRTGERNITGFVSDLHDFNSSLKQGLDELTGLIKAHNRSWVFLYKKRWSQATVAVDHILYNRLKKYHPELTI